MHSWTQRFNAVVTFAITVLAFMAGAIAITGYFQARSADLVRNDSDVNSMVKFTMLRNTGNEQALFSYNFDFDVEPLFHWNTKQVFVYLTATYESASTNSSVVIWDKILRYNTEKQVNDENVFMKYPLIDKGRNLKGQKVTFSLSWDLTPFVGVMYKQHHPRTFTFTMPEEYSVLSGQERQYINQFTYETDY